MIAAKAETRNAPDILVGASEFFDRRLACAIKKVATWRDAFWAAQLLKPDEWLA